MWIGKDLLRSSYEIYFYEKYKELKIEYDISIDKKYPESSFRYDFKVKDDYIEICPMIHENHDYKLKMLKKKQIFNCILLSSIKEIDAYLEKLYENFR